MAKKHPFVCEGCATVERAAIQPDGWTGYGMSGIAPNTTAVWCATCRAAGLMDRYSVTTYRRARSVAKSRGLLNKLVDGAE